MNRQFRETKPNADAFETQTLLDDEVRQGLMVPGHEDIFSKITALKVLPVDKYIQITTTGYMPFLWIN